jgi:hypothetical protein
MHWDAKDLVMELVTGTSGTTSIEYTPVARKGSDSLSWMMKAGK